MLRSLALVSVMLLVLSACQGGARAPWQRGSEPPPVELLDDDDYEGAPVTAPDGRLGLSPDQRFKDVPVPANAREDADRTYVYESSDLRIGRMVYTSRSTVNELAQFYIQEAPAADWHLDSVLQAEGAQLLFRKPGKRLDVSIKPQGVGRSNLIILNLTPEGAGAR